MKRVHRLWSAVTSPNDSRRSEAGDTLLEVLFTLLVIGLCSVALITAFSTSVSASAEERYLVTINTVVRSTSEWVFAQFQQTSSPFDPTCTASKANYPTIIPSAPVGYAAKISSVQYLQNGVFGPSCTAGSTSPQLITITVSGPGSSGGTNSFVVQDVNSTPPVVGPVHQLVFISAPTSGLASGTANLGPITVEEQDVSGNPTTTAETVDLTSNSAGTAVFSASPNGSAITSIAIPNGSSTATFYYGDTKAGTPTITAAASGLTSATQQETIGQGAASQLVFTTTKFTGSASATTNLGAMTVQEEDSYGNPTTTAVTVNLSTSSSGTTEFSATPGSSSFTSIGIASGSSTATFYYGDTKVGTPTITAAASGLTSATQQETVTPASAHQLVFTTGSMTGPTSASTNLGPMTVQEEDSFGNLTTSAETVSLSSTSSGAEFSTTLGGTSVSSVAIASGSSTATFYYGDTKAGTPTITAGASGLSGATQQETIKPLPTITSPNAGSPYSVVDGGNANFTITGTGFAPNATVSFSGGGFTNIVVTYVSPTKLTVTASVGGKKDKGTFNLTVTDPGIGSATSNSAIVVT
jgi:hypothetical protein